MACRVLSEQNADIWPIRPQGTYSTEILFEIRKFSSKNIRLKTSFAKWQPFRLGLIVLSNQ